MVKKRDASVNDTKTNASTNNAGTSNANDTNSVANSGVAITVNSNADTSAVEKSGTAGSIQN